MRKLQILFYTLLFLGGTIAINSCSTSNKGSNDESEEHEHSEAGEESEEGHDDGEEGEEHSHDSGGHMDHMNDVREMLKETLGDKYDAPEFPEPTEEQLVLGKGTFTSTCAACHGTEGKGDGAAAIALDPKPADFTDDSHSKYYSDAGRMYIIRNGVEGTGMVGWKAALSEEQLMNVYLYVRSLRIPVDNMAAAGMYACPMHPEITSDKAGDKCSKCGMELVMNDEPEDDGHDHEH